VRSANDASAMVFLVVESEKTHVACGAVLSALGNATEAVHGVVQVLLRIRGLG
jgi:hypothetical protein